MEGWPCFSLMPFVIGNRFPAVLCQVIRLSLTRRCHFPGNSPNPSSGLSPGPVTLSPFPCQTLALQPCVLFGLFPPFSCQSPRANVMFSYSLGVLTALPILFFVTPYFAPGTPAIMISSFLRVRSNLGGRTATGRVNCKSLPRRISRVEQSSMTSQDSLNHLI